MKSDNVISLTEAKNREKNWAVIPTLGRDAPCILRLGDPTTTERVGCSATNTSIYKQSPERVGRRKCRFESVAGHVRTMG
jgi:hypothetical protein